MTSKIGSYAADKGKGSLFLHAHALLIHHSEQLAVSVPTSGCQKQSMFFLVCGASLLDAAWSVKAVRRNPDLVFWHPWRCGAESLV